MWAEAIAFVKSLFGGKGAIQVGEGQQSASTTGTNSPILNATGNITYTAGSNSPSAAERDAELLAEVQVLMPEIIEAINDLLNEDPLLREIVVQPKSSYAYNWPRPHGMFSDDTHPDATRKFQILESYGLVRKIKPIAYELSPRFVRMLKGQS
jgi:hypothetical protein